MQSCGTTGQVQNCQVGVFLSYVTAKGHTLIDRELPLPLDWCADQQRCQAAHVPETVRFQTKPELAIRMLERIFHAHLPIGWVVADTVAGGTLDLRTWCEQHQYPYVMAVACNEPVGIVTPDGVRRRVEAGAVEALVLPLTIPEVRHLLARLLWPPSSSVRWVLAWSWWRRCHQSRASYFHTKRRLKAG